MQNKFPKILLGVFALSLIASIFLYLNYTAKKTSEEPTENEIYEDVIITQIETSESTQSTPEIIDLEKETPQDEIVSLIKNIQTEFTLEFGLIRECVFEWLLPSEETPTELESKNIKGKCTKVTEVQAVYETRIIDYLSQDLFYIDKVNSSGSIAYNKTALTNNEIVCVLESTVSSYDPTLQLDLNNLDTSQKNISLSCGYLDQ